VDCCARFEIGVFGNVMIASDRSKAFFGQRQVKEPFDSPDWIFETKLDGYTAIAVIESYGKARLRSRNHLPLEPKFPTIGDALRPLKLRSTILDDEIIA
jgi:ATP-dependent DNA ligase